MTKYLFLPHINYQSVLEISWLGLLLDMLMHSWQHCFTQSVIADILKHVQLLTFLIDGHSQGLLLTHYII
jgi:hypothetical protein